MPIVQDHHQSHPYPKLHHVVLDTTFCGINHSASTPDAPIHQYLGIKYASIPARFRQSKLFSSYPTITDTSEYGPICPQSQEHKTTEEILFGVNPSDIPHQDLKHDEFECLNLNITCPAGLGIHSRLPVMVWIHGGGDRGSGSSWIYDGGAMVRKSIEIGKPMILVTLNFRIGLLGFACSPAIREDNIATGEDGTGNYGLRDQRKALEWLHYYIQEFGGDPRNITLFGESSGAMDIVCHLLSAANETRPLFSRAIIQSAIFEPYLPNVANAGWHLSRIMSALHLSTVDHLRTVDVNTLASMHSMHRAIDDGVFFRKGWKDYFVHEDRHHGEKETPLLKTTLSPRHKSRSRSRLRDLCSPSRPSVASTPKLQHLHNLQPIIIGDCCSDSLLWSSPISTWNAPAVVRRLKAVTQSLTKANNLLRAFEINNDTPDHEIVDRILELVNDARVAWPTEVIAENARRERGGRNVWRYVFDQEGPSRGVPHHAADLIYLFDNVPLPELKSPPPSEEFYCDGPFDDVDDDEIEIERRSFGSEDEWETYIVDQFSYARVRDAIQERWISFAHGESPWHEDRVFVFGPEGETGERSRSIFEGRRRRQLWKDIFEPLGMQLVQKVGAELSRGP
ncbi:alpha/beta-hydrolase [Macrolepiota fuliginosa MF-IS2]|uniref:Carboxylic ester hydrolase n=1 Tax=Macrolepiota fuliginosa MF-IS2 TaxID=1400762 RepID=A0A9P5X344_9AGAR|nr:alpha/beta-hydrolase [Macrolepiota fuliginosa MF-IS2]